MAGAGPWVKSAKDAIRDAQEFAYTAHEYWLQEDWPRAQVEAAISTANSMLALMEINAMMLERLEQQAVS